MIYVVLGMHKSGTTLVAQILHHSGIHMGEDQALRGDYDQGNFYEREAAWRLNEAILNAHGVHILAIRRPRPLRLTEGQRQTMRSLIDDCNQRHPDWGFKDPRTCLVYPLWAAELPEHKLIVIYRDPDEAWPRYRPRGLRRRLHEPYLAWNYLRSWCDHNAQILSYLQPAMRDYLVVEYGRLVTTPAEFDRLQAFVGRPLCDRRQPALYRNHATRHRILALAEWLVRRTDGCQPRLILQQLAAYRHKHGPNNFAG